MMRNIINAASKLFEDQSTKDQLRYADTNEEISEIISNAMLEAVKLPNGEIIYKDDQNIYVWDREYADVEIYDHNEYVYDVRLHDIFGDIEEIASAEFWKFPMALYHATPQSNLNSILRKGLGAQSASRGLSNRGVGDAVFTVTDPDLLHDGSYGDCIFEINTAQMKSDGYMPMVVPEPGELEAEYRERLARIIGLDGFYADREDGMWSETRIVHDGIPPKYLTQVE